MNRWKIWRTQNLHVMRFLGLSLEDDVPDILFYRDLERDLRQQKVWDGLLAEISRLIRAYNITVKQGCHVDASIV